MRVRFAASAIAQIAWQVSHVERDNPAAARRLTETIIAAADRLAVNPRLGHPGTVAGTFEMVVRPYILVYEIRDDYLAILHLWHGRQRRPGT